MVNLIHALISAFDDLLRLSTAALVAVLSLVVAAGVVVAGLLLTGFAGFSGLGVARLFRSRKRP